ncbi:MAG: hypothetical protein H6622_07495 [Halobacteriovoraceae bacterium]|nr:hypothetical protein [Halobacteriovoraceae bacterium]
MSKKKIAGMSLKGGQKDNFFFCLLEYYEDGQRCFLKSLLHVKDEESPNGNEAIHSWIDEYELKELVIDFPLTTPPCLNCDLTCPGAEICPVEDVVSMRNRVNELLLEDKNREENNPKKYERERNEDDLVDNNKNNIDKLSSDHLLSRSFKRKLKRGIIPYWNRTIDLYVWENYYDKLLDLFSISYDSFGNTSLMLMNRLIYLRKHFPKALELYESNIYICLIELLKARIITKKDLVRMLDIEGTAIARLDIIRKIEKKLNIFVYDKDLEVLSYNVRAFESFLLALCGQRWHLGQTRDIGPWRKNNNEKFISPYFVSVIDEN